MFPLPRTPSPQRGRRQAERRLKKEISDAKTTPAKLLHRGASSSPSGEDWKEPKRVRVEAPPSQPSQQMSPASSSGSGAAAASSSSGAGASAAGIPAGLLPEVLPFVPLTAAAAAADVSTSSSDSGGRQQPAAVGSREAFSVSEPLFGQGAQGGQGGQNQGLSSPRARALSPTSEAWSPGSSFAGLSPYRPDASSFLGRSCLVAPPWSAASRAQGPGQQGEDSAPNTPPGQVIGPLRTPGAPRIQRPGTLEPWERLAMTHGGSSEWEDEDINLPGSGSDMDADSP